MTQKLNRNAKNKAGKNKIGKEQDTDHSEGKVMLHNEK